MLHIKYLTLIFGMIFLFGIVSSANYYSTDPDNCPSSDATNYPGQNCAPQDICGDNSGIAQCYDTSTMNPPAGSSTTTGTGGTDYSCSDTTCSGGYVTNCYATIDSGAPYCDNNGAYLIDRNPTCYNKHVQTTATGGAFVTSSCSATCTTNYFACDGDTTDADGCEIHAGDSCGSGTGTIVYNQCYSASAGNCTSSTRLDCDDSDSDGNPATCNVGNGCEILIGGACTVGALSGTYGSTCTGSSGTCLLTPQHFITSTKAEYQSNATNPFLWGIDYNLGHLINLSWSVGGGFYVNASGAYFNGTLLGSGGAETDPYWTANQSNYFNTTDILGFGYYNFTDFDINDYFTSAEVLGFNYFNTSNTYNCTSGQVVMNLTLNSSGVFGKCIVPTLSESDPLWSANYTLYNASWSSITNTSYYLTSNPFGFFNTSNTYNCTSGQWVQNLTLNSSGAFGKCSAPTLTESDPLWTANKSSYYNTTQILGFGFWNNTFATFNKTYADTLYYALNNPYGYFNTSYRYNCTSGQYFQNATINSSGIFGMCSAPTLSESDPLWSANYTLYNSSWSSITNTSYYLASNPFGYFNTSNTYNCTSGQVIQNLTLNSSGAFGICVAQTGGGGNPFDQSLNTTDNVLFSNINSTNNVYINKDLKIRNGDATYESTISDALTNIVSDSIIINTVGEDLVLNVTPPTKSDLLVQVIGGLNASKNITASWFIGYLNWSNIQNPKTALSQFTNDLNFINSTYGNATYLKKGGDTMSGNLNMSSYNITITNGTSAGKICFTQSCSSYIYHNGTGLVMK